MTTAAKSTISTSSPAFGGAVLGMLLGLAFLGWSVYGVFGTPRPPAVLSIVMISAALIDILLCWGALRRSRGGWAFACSLNGSMAVVYLFGIPHVRDGLSVHVSIAVVPFLAFAMATALLAAGSREFE